MSVRAIVVHPAPILRQVAEPVTTLDERLVMLIKDLTDTMRHHRALGLAAPQIGVPLRVCVIEQSRCGRKARAPEKWEAPLVLINPELSGFAGKTHGVEGCLSLPGRQIQVRRARRCLIHASDSAGNRGAFGWVHELEARVVQHEVDHLDGILIIDQGSKLRRRTAEASA